MYLSVVICEKADERPDKMFDLHGAGILAVPASGAEFAVVAIAQGGEEVKPGRYIIRAFGLLPDGSRFSQEARATYEVPSGAALTRMITALRIGGSRPPGLVRIIAEVDRVSDDGASTESVLRAEVPLGLMGTKRGA
jgi:hypothetical protein